jgi:hypothetical protein
MNDDFSWETLAIEVDHSYQRHQLYEYLTRLQLIRVIENSLGKVVVQSLLLMYWKYELRKVK